MTIQELEAKYLNKVVHYYPISKKMDIATNKRHDVYGKIDSITRETAFGEPTIIFQMNRRRFEIDEVDFEDRIIVLL